MDSGPRAHHDGGVLGRAHARWFAAHGSAHRAPPLPASPLSRHRSGAQNRRKRRGQRAGIRLHHRRRRLGRLRAGQPADRRSGKTSVLLLEAGGKDTDPWIHIPAGFYRNIYNPKVAWYFETEPVPEMNNRRIPWPRGKVLGGSSSINGLIYIRGQRQDFDLWRQLGNAGWSYDDVLPYFRKAEDQEHGADEFHGAGGPLGGVRPAHRASRCMTRFIDGAQEAGYPVQPRTSTAPSRKASGRCS